MQSFDNPAGGAPLTTCPAASGGSSGGSTTRLFDPLGGVTIPSLIGRVIRAMIGLVGSIALLMFIYGGIRWITAGGDSKNVEQAKSIIKHSTIGLIMIFLSYTIVAIFFAALTNTG